MCGSLIVWRTDWRMGACIKVMVSKEGWYHCASFKHGELEAEIEKRWLY